MRVVVTGGAGFIGSHVVDRLVRRGDDVVVVDDADAVLHLAGFVRAGMRLDPYHGGRLQLQGTLNVLEACRARGGPCSMRWSPARRTPRSSPSWPRGGSGRSSRR